MARGGKRTSVSDGSNGQKVVFKGSRARGRRSSRGQRINRAGSHRPYGKELYTFDF